MSKIKKIDSISNATYVMIDSSQRNLNDEIEFEGELYSVSPNGLEFINGSSTIKINLPYHPFQIDDQISLGNVVSKNSIMKNVLMMKKSSSYLRIYHENHGLSYYGRFDSSNILEFEPVDFVENLPLSFTEEEIIFDSTNYYVLKNSADLVVELSNIKGTNFNRNLIGNIPINFLNAKHTVHLIFSFDGPTFKHDPNNYLIKLDKKCSINYADGVNYNTDVNNSFTKEVSENTIYIKYHNLYGIPLSILNCQSDSIQILSILDVESDAFFVDIGHLAIVDPFNSFYNLTDNIGLEQNTNFGSNSRPNFGGGNQCFVRKVSNIKKGYPSPSNYVVKLDREFLNIESIKIIGSSFPNSVPMINSSNNKLYWKNEEDGDHIYSIQIESGTYSMSKLRKILEKKFSSTPRISYKNCNNLDQNPNLTYDKDGFNKYHTIDVDISEETNTVSFSSYQERLLGSNSILVPDTMIQLDVNIECEPLDNDIWLFYLTPRSHPLDPKYFPFAYNNLYRQTNNIINYTANSTIGTTIDATIDLETIICLNFYRKEQLTDNLVNEIKSINSNVLLVDFTFDYLNKIVNHKNHLLKEQTIIITDKFIDPMVMTVGQRLFVYQIVKIIDKNSYSVKKYDMGKKYKLVYDNLIFNFAEGFVVDKFINSIEPMIHFPSILRIYHPNHFFSPNTQIKISSSGPINRVPQTVLNSEHLISKIISDNEYLIELDKYIPLDTVNERCQLVSVKYPMRIQLMFNFPDTVGPVLGFENCGKPGSITGFKHCIRNIDFGSNPNIKIPQSNYFYICSPELSHIEGTKPVSNVFAIGQLTSDHGKISHNCTIPSIKTYIPPLKHLSEINFCFKQKNDQLVDFNGADHSFVLEIIESHPKLDFDQDFGTGWHKQFNI